MLADRASVVVDTQREAQQDARRFAATSGGGEVRVHGTDGWIRSTNTIGQRDPELATVPETLVRQTLFAEQFLVPLIDVDQESSSGRYDAGRRLSLREDGRPVVELGAPELATTTKVRREADDFHRDATLVATSTKALGEPDDLHRDELLLATTTRNAPGEEDDFSREGRILRVLVAADAPYRMTPQDILDLKVRNDKGAMVPFGAFTTVGWTAGPPSSAALRPPRARAGTRVAC